MAYPDYHTETRTATGSDGSVETLEVLVCDDCKTVRYCGDWPICPHTPGIFGEDPIEPYFDEHITESGEWITTRGQRQKIMRQHGLEYRKKRFDLLTGRVKYFDFGKR